MNRVLLAPTVASILILSAAGCDPSSCDDDPPCGDDDSGDDDSGAGDDDSGDDDSGDDDSGDDDSAAGDDDSGDDDTGSETPLVALYDDTDHADAGAWAEGLDALEQAMTDDGIAVQRITREQLNDQVGLLASFDAIVFGGGYAYPGYTLRIDAGGKARLQEFVHAGGAYVGICAGAYAACADLVYEGSHWDTESGYDLDLYDGTCFGPVGAIAHYPDWALAHLEFPGHEATDGHAPGPFDRDLWYAGGPYFDQAPSDVEVLATYDEPGIAQDGMPAVVAEPYGAGVVVLWGPHPEVDDPGASSDNRPLFSTVVRWAASRAP